MLNGHLDTVSLESYEGDALDPAVEPGRLRGRGSYDMKSGLAAMMIAASRVAARPRRGDILLALVADEEYGSAGTEEVLRHFTADGAVFSRRWAISGMLFLRAHPTPNWERRACTLR